MKREDQRIRGFDDSAIYKFAFDIWHLLKRRSAPPCGLAVFCLPFGKDLFVGHFMQVVIYWLVDEWLVAFFVVWSVVWTVRHAFSASLCSSR